VVDRYHRRVEVSFDSSVVDSRHAEWLESVKQRAGLGELNPQPYWGFEDLFHSVGTKLKNCFYVKAQVKREGGREFYLYSEIAVLQSFSLEKLLEAIEGGYVLVDFDARTGHNHGTKFRLRQDYLPNLYATVTRI